MWQPRIASTALILTCLTCLVAGQQQPETGDVDLNDLIKSVFNAEAAASTQRTTTADQTGNLGFLVDQLHNNTENESYENRNNKNENGAGGTFLGVNNENTGNVDDCECVPYYQCQNGTILEDGTGLIDIRFDFRGDEKAQESQSFSGPCDNYLHICCKPPNIKNPDERITPPPLERKGCGQRHPDGVGFRITGQTDNEAQFGEFPWMVAILQEEVVSQQMGQVLNVYQCGGSLIHPQAVLTAAHCVVNKTPAQLKVRAGEWDTQTANEILPHQDRNVRDVIVHKKYRHGSLHNDFAILILSSPVDIAENVDVVCLPERNACFDDSRCFASGWGKDVFGKEGNYQVILKRVELPVVSHNTCQNTLRNTRLGRYFVLNESFICAGGENGKDTCKGDGGSPLVCPIRNDPSRYVQAGIVSWGIGCGENNVPGVYANVASARSWIDEQIAYNNLDNTQYQYSSP